MCLGCHGLDGQAPSGTPLAQELPLGQHSLTRHSEAADRILVRFAPSVAPQAEAAAHHRARATVQRSFEGSVPGLRWIEPRGRLQATIAAYRANPNVVYAHRDPPVNMLAVPDDTRFAEQWALHNTGQNGGTVDVDINGPEAWDSADGSGVVVGVIDSGIDYDHPDLAPNIWTNPGEIPGNGTDDDGNGWIDDVHGINVRTGTGDPMDDGGHGSHVAAIIGAAANDTHGVAGVAPGVKLIGCKFMDAVGNASLGGAIACLDYFRDLKTRVTNPVPIVATNNSWGSVFHLQAIADAVLAQMDAGILFVAAAGNSAASNDLQSAWVYPAGYR